MIVDEKTYHLINSFLSGELKGRELDKFKASLREDKDFKNLVDQQKEIISAIEQTREKELKEFLSKGTKTKTIPIMSSKTRLLLGAAASIALIAVVFFTISNNTSRDVVTESNESINKDLNTDELANTDLQVIDTQALTKELNQSDSENLAIETEKDAIDLPQDEELTEDSEPSEIEKDLAEIVDESLDINLVDSNGVTNSDIAVSTLPELVEDEGKAESDTKKEEAILKDELSLATTFTIAQVSLDFNGAARSTESTSKAIKKNSEEDTSYDDELTANKSRNLAVEYWTSVVNFKGYKYDGQKVKLYSISADNNLVFKELDNRLYMKMDGVYFHLEKSNNYKRLVEVTNPTLLNVLND